MTQNAEVHHWLHLRLIKPFLLVPNILKQK